MKKAAGGVTTLYFYDPEGKLLEEYVPATGTGKDYVWMPGTYEPLARIDFSMADNDNGNVLRVTKSSPNVHLDWSLDGTSGPFTIKRSASFTFSNPIYLGPGQTAKTFNDAVLGNTTSYAYETFRRTLTDTLYFYHANHLGTPIAMTGSTGALVWRAEHTPFGGIYALTVGTIANNLRFPGQYYDGETGLAQNWFRDYRHNTGRYWEPDPLGIGAGDVSSKASLYQPGVGRFLLKEPISFWSRDFNLYRYASDSPLVYYDPSGTQADDEPRARDCIAKVRKTKEGWEQRHSGLAGSDILHGAEIGSALGFTTGLISSGHVGAGIGAIAGGAFGAIGGAVVAHASNKAARGVAIKLCVECVGRCCPPPGVSARDICIMAWDGRLPAP